MPRYGRDYMPRYGMDYHRGRGTGGRGMRDGVWNRGMGGMGGGFRSRAWNEGSYRGHEGSWTRGEMGPRYDGPFRYGRDVEGSRWGGSERFRGGYGGYGSTQRGDMPREGIMRGGMLGGGYGHDFHGSRAGRGGAGHGRGEDDRDFGDRLRSGWNQLRRGVRGMMGDGYDRGW